MKSTQESTPQHWREYRRLRAWEMHQQGYKQQAIADALWLTQGAVSYIIKRARQAALQHHKSPGAPARVKGKIYMADLPILPFASQQAWGNGLKPQRGACAF